MLNLAGFVGVDPTPFTYYELVLMAEGKHKEMWQHTASLEAMIANSVRDPKRRRRPYTAEDFYPPVFRDRRGKTSEGRASISVLKKAFVDNRYGQPIGTGKGRTSVYRSPPIQ